MDLSFTRLEMFVENIVNAQDLWICGSMRELPRSVLAGSERFGVQMMDFMLFVLGRVRWRGFAIGATWQEMLEVLLTM